MGLLDKLKKKNVCPHCGKEVKEGMTFCPFCGNKTEREKTYCASCSSEVGEDMLFCPVCGHNLRANEYASAQEPSAEAIVVPTQAVEEQAALAEAAVALEVASSEQAVPAAPVEASDYNVVILASPSGSLALVKVIQRELGVDLSAARLMSKISPFPLFTKLNETDAKIKAAQLREEGLVVKITRGDISNQPKKNTVSAPIKSEAEQRKSKLKLSAILSMCGAMVSIVIALFALFLPMFTDTYYETIGEDRVLKEENVSAFNTLILSVKALTQFAGGDVFSYLGILELSLVLVVLGTVAYLVVISVKQAIEKIKYLINFDENCEKELNVSETVLAAQEVVKSFRKNVDEYRLFAVIIELPFVMWVFGYNSIVWGSIITISILAIGGVIIDKVAKRIKKKAMNT